ncbi:YtxH domain-containing protein [Aliifodinibius salicampi]|jgi:gas vesicle protein|uniref:YtxH domain-containing protein n=1 Tax=Fodinibius salicampi TaxID=1920655 RepID=A0ABT3Q2A5_9BACT|nr:YtxH domain-containing protein [Fodinibius salicampi]MCW9714257.1 YtxH domain-containing protein [Fodinibius salicampi]
MSKSKDFTLGLLSGALVGSVIALLYAPDKGSNTRDVLSYRLSSYMDELTHLIDKLSDEKESISEAKRKGDLVVEDARKRAEDLINEAEDLLGSIEKAKENVKESE